MNGESGNPMERAWCDECGCGLWIRSPVKKPDMTNLKAGMQDCGHHRFMPCMIKDCNISGGKFEGHVLIYAGCSGLFKPGEIPNPTMENWLKNLEPWETPATGTKRTALNNQSKDLVLEESTNVYAFE